ncbi:hypothetical protein RHGRI_000260 [Rhododendron griersonianum]|uniref:Uncharacterized protein n=1 Tax=Rhododendron griersonianum TaxID=479676 RepID=A0AAV6LI89_9ERIC|nr:hypothetical protein RHGRI_000260 [Rhododendron griersonianum]
MNKTKMPANEHGAPKLSGSGSTLQKQDLTLRPLLKDGPGGDYEDGDYVKQPRPGWRSTLEVCVGPVGVYKQDQ